MDQLPFIILGVILLGAIIWQGRRGQELRLTADINPDVRAVLKELRDLIDELKRIEQQEEEEQLDEDGGMLGHLKELNDEADSIRNALKDLIEHHAGVMTTQLQETTRMLHEAERAIPIQGVFEDIAHKFTNLLLSDKLDRNEPINFSIRKHGDNYHAIVSLTEKKEVKQEQQAQTHPATSSL